MALNGIGNTKVTVILYQNYKYIELTPEESIEFTREPNCPTRLTLTMRRDNFSANEGDYIGVALDVGHNVFKGIVWNVDMKKDRMEITAYDQLIAMQKSTTLFVYENMTSTQVLQKCVDELGLETAEESHMMDTGYVIPSRIEEKSSYMDIFQNSLDETFKNTNMHYYLWDDAGNIVLWDNEHMVVETCMVSAQYIEEYTLSKGFDDFFNYIRVDAVSSSGAENDGQRQTAISQNQWQVENVLKLSKFEEEQNESNPQQVADSLLYEYNRVKPELSVTRMQGDPRVRGGSLVYVDFLTEDKIEYIRGWFRVKSVTHKVKSGFHTMDMNMVLEVDDR